MVVLVVEQDHVLAIESERQAPVAAHPERLVPGEIAGESVQVPTGHVQVTRLTGSVESAEHSREPFPVTCLDTRFRSGFEEPLQSLVTEAPDYGATVYRDVTLGNGRNGPTCPALCGSGALAANRPVVIMGRAMPAE